MAFRGALGSGLGARDAAAFCVAGVAQRLTSTFISRGRRGTNSHLPSFHLAGVALMAWGGALGSGLGAPLSCCNKIARMKPLCVCYILLLAQVPIQ